MVILGGCADLSRPLKRQTKFAADDILMFYFLLSFKENKTIISRESSAQHQVLFSLKNNEKIFMNVVCCSRVWPL